MPPFLSESSGLIEPANASSRAEIDAAMETAPDVEWRLIIALSRYAGLRIPSELLSLRWIVVDLPGGRMTIRASKTEFVINPYRQLNQNLRTTFQKILARAVVKPWPKLFHNMRASRQTELLDHFPIKAVCDRLGNSTPVAIEHYSQVTAKHFSTALYTITAPPSVPNRDGKSEAKSEVAGVRSSRRQFAGNAKSPGVSRALRDNFRSSCKCSHGR
jgi:hypothetical protein